MNLHKTRVHGMLGVMVLFVTGCTYDRVIPPEQTEFEYLFLGHIYQWHSPHESNRIDHRLEVVDFGSYDGILLGGDLCTEVTKFENTLVYLDDLFDLTAPRTLWSVGNHDVRNGNTHLIEKYTGRPLFFTQSSGGIQWIVLNTSIDDTPDLQDPCVVKDDQIRMIYHTLDTISQNKIVVMMMHHVVWGNVEPGMQTQEAANSNRPSFNFACDSSVQFATHIYPRLVDLTGRGIQCVVLSGDGGQYQKTYSYLTADGIRFFISGINNSVDTTVYQPTRPFDLAPDSVLLMYVDTSFANMDVRFIPLTDLTD